MRDDITALKAHPSVSSGIKSAVDRASGAELHRCALQVNPFEYLERHSVVSPFVNEDDYNEAIIQACLANGVSVIGITDHFRVHTSEKLALQARAEGIVAFQGFEANSSDGVHILCLFPEEMSSADINLVIGACGVSDFTSTSPQANIDCEKILELVRRRNGVALAAHVCATSGLLVTLKGQTRMKVWKSESLTAVCLPGPRKDAPMEHRAILSNTDPAHARERLVAVVNANDVSDPQSFTHPSCTTLVRMSARSIEGLRQAFLDWESRIRLNTDEVPEDHVELIAAAWDGGLLDGQSIRFNSGLNALIGGRGAGKSTLIESLRHVFELKPKGKEALRAHDGLVKNVLQNGTKVSVLLYSPRPTPQRYLLERVIPNPTVVRGENGALLSGITPKDIIPDIECYGQHEVSELTRDPELLARLLDRFVENNEANSETKADFLRKLATSRSEISHIHRNLLQAEEDLSGLPALREKLNRFEAAGLSDRLKAKSEIDREKRRLSGRKEQVNDIQSAVAQLEMTSLLEELVEEKGKPVPRASILVEADDVIAELNASLIEAKQGMETAINRARASLSAIETRWQTEIDPLNDQYQATLRDLQREGINGADFITTQNQIAELRQREQEAQELGNSLADARAKRNELVVEYENVKAVELRALERAARKVGQQLDKTVRVTVRRGTSLRQLDSVLRATISGQGPASAIEKLRATNNLSLPDLANAVREGPNALSARYGFTTALCEKLAACGDAVAMQIEEVELPAEAILELNVAEQGDKGNWKKLDDLSTGQKATAVLLLLLLGSDEPLLVDQPEDDLDNRFITKVVVPTMRTEKRRRQFIFSTHNANIPVLADAEQIIGLLPVVEHSVERTVIRPELVGSIDAEPIKKLVGNLLEGGRTAFELRRRKYGF